VENIQHDRQPLVDSLYECLSRTYKPLTPAGSKTSIVAFTLPDAISKLGDRIRESRINIQLYRNRFRISPSIYNTMDDVDRVVNVLSS
jgi:selenocysteine lyase/cysteine desulfurase